VTTLNPPGAPSDSERRIVALVAYWHEHRETYTPDALARAARQAGYDDVEIAKAKAIVDEQAGVPAGPVRRRATLIVLLAYGLTYLFFGIGFLGPTSQSPYSPYAFMILTVVLGLALLISVILLRRRPMAQNAGATVASFLVAPIVLLVIVAGLCVATTGSMMFPSAVPR
jgi:hypothetical protein